MTKQTEQFLAKCLELGLKRVCIGVANPIVPESMTFTFGPYNAVFGLKRKNAQTHDYNGWPAIWAVVNQLGIGGGCGNSNQHQVSPVAMAQLDLGAYVRQNGKWKRL